MKAKKVPLDILSTGHMTLTLTGKNLAIFCDSLFKRDSEVSFYEAFNDLVEERPEVSTEDSENQVDGGKE